MNANEVRDVVSNISYKRGWLFHFVESTDGKSLGYLQIECLNGTDSVTGDHCIWKSRKQPVSLFVCKQEIAGAILSLIKDAEMHEVHEWFRYKGASIYNPHLDPDALVEVARKKESFIVRNNSMTEV